MKSAARRARTETRAIVSAQAPACQVFVDWMAASALPFWAGYRDPGGLPFAEAAHLDGSPAERGFVRLRVMARQVAVYAQAAEAGVAGAYEAAERGWGALERLYWSTISGWADRIVPLRRQVDQSLALYDQAFAIYACVCWARASGTLEPISMAMRTLELINRSLKVCDVPGWRSRTGDSLRDQNAHMHFLEALLALNRINASWQVQCRVEEVLSVLASHLYDPLSGAITEWFDDSWSPLSGKVEVEPGHLYEWFWLVSRARAEGFEVEIDEHRLLEFAGRHGWNASRGLVYDSCAPDGTVLASSHRLWPHCEALRAESLLYGRTGDPSRANDLAERLHRHFLAPAAAGCWLDRLTAELEPAVDHVPASSLYHLWEAAAALVDAGLANWPENASC